MKTKLLLNLTILSFLIGCQDAYQRQSVLNPIGIQVSNSAQRDVDDISKTQNPMARPSYQEYQESIKGEIFEPQ